MRIVSHRLKQHHAIAAMDVGREVEQDLSLVWLLRTMLKGQRADLGVGVYPFLTLG
jgi:hypothetical protein